MARRGEVADAVIKYVVERVGERIEVDKIADDLGFTRDQCKAVLHRITKDEQRYGVRLISVLPGRLWRIAEIEDVRPYLDARDRLKDVAGVTVQGDTTRHYPTAQAKGPPDPTNQDLTALTAPTGPPLPPQLGPSLPLQPTWPGQDTIYEVCGIRPQDGRLIIKDDKGNMYYAALELIS